MQGRAKKERKPMTEEAVCIGVDVAKSTLDVAVSDSPGRHDSLPMTMKASVRPSAISLV
jgi:hypothetical protein